MPSLKEIADAFQATASIVSNNPLSTALLSIGILLLLAAIAFLVMGLLGQAPSRRSQILSVISLLMGVGFAGSGTALSIFEIHWIKPIISQREGLKRLSNNSEVVWVARLIAFSTESRPDLIIDKLRCLGRCDDKVTQMFTFVADYAEIRGRPAMDVVKSIGARVRNVDRVSAVFFPLRGVPEKQRVLYPANARGLLQVIELIDAQAQNDAGYTPYAFKEHLSSDARKDLAKSNDDISSYAFTEYADHYDDYCKLAQEFRCAGEDSYSARKFLGEINDDWHPLGFAQRISPRIDPCKKQEKQCEITSLDTDSPLEKVFGSRVFLMPNVEIASLKGRVTVDFDDPEQQYIPELTFDAAEW